MPLCYRGQHNWQQARGSAKIDATKPWQQSGADKRLQTLAGRFVFEAFDEQGLFRTVLDRTGR